MSDDAVKPLRSPVVWDEAIPPVEWPGGSPRFPIDARFYLAAFRGATAALVRAVRRHRDLIAPDRPRPAKDRLIAASAAKVQSSAESAKHYHGGLARAERVGFIYPESVDIAFRLAKEDLIDAIEATLPGRSFIDFAEAFATDETLELCEFVLSASPPVTFDFSKPPTPAVAPDATPPNPRECESTPEAPAVAPPPSLANDDKPPGRRKPGARAFIAYRASKLTGAKQEDIAIELGKHQSTVSRWIREVGEWLEAGNVLPPDIAAELNAKPSRRMPTPMDPRSLEQGPRLDKRRA